MPRDEAAAILPPAGFKPVMGCASVTDAIEFLTMLEELREGEGAAVTFFDDNLDFGSAPNAAVDMVFDWEEMPTRFAGYTVLEALRAALATKRAR